MSPSRLEIHIDGIYIDSRGMVNAPVHVVISDWKHASIDRFDSTGANPIELKLSQCGELREICEWSVVNSGLLLAGFERGSGHWQQFNFSHPNIEIKIDE